MGTGSTLAPWKALPLFIIIYKYDLTIKFEKNIIETGYFQSILKKKSLFVILFERFIFAKTPKFAIGHGHFQKKKKKQKHVLSHAAKFSPLAISYYSFKKKNENFVDI